MNERKDIIIGPEMTVLDVISNWRETESVFKGYDEIAGECVCCNALFDTVGQMTKRYKLDLDRVISDLKNAVSETTGRPGD